MSQPNASVAADPVLAAQHRTDAQLAELRQKLVEGSLNPEADAQLLADLVENFSDPRGLTRMAIAEALAEVGKPASPYLIGALAQHPNPVIRRACAKTLTLIADRTAIPTLIDALLNDPDTVVHGSAVGALARLGEDAVPELIAILATPATPETTKGHLAWALAFIGAEASEPIYREIGSDSAAVRAAVVGAVASIAESQPEDRAFRLLLDALNDPAQNVRSEAAAALSKIEHKPAIPALLEMLDRPEGESRKAAALALMKLSGKEAIAPLSAALERESDDAVQKAIKLAIMQIERRLETEEEGW
ncbi:HEAT repeat domain-containing protein [Synechococcus sp. PCC 7336]|uniref:HEAT repeat domain-containing protein n=1 Tax=Synechococcus sp. PCC 7336 TaxID=195250 RepID=UPI000346E2E0|nr:HEAT repeat domain-containing protein [Synechococcus sp. PCC 7336]